MTDTEPTRTVTLTVTGHPVAKGRGRAVQTPNGPRIYTPKKTAQFEQDVRQVARAEMQYADPMYGPVSIVFKAFFAPPSSWPNWKQEAALAGALAHTAKPDVDNLVKTAQDAMNGIVFVDDQNIFRMFVLKGYSTSPHISVRVDEYTEVRSAAKWREIKGHLDV